MSLLQPFGILNLQQTMKDTNNINTPRAANYATNSKIHKGDDDGSFKVVSHRRTNNTARTRKHTDSTGDIKVVDATMMKMFQTFHKDLLPIMERIFNDPRNQENVSVQRWQQALKGKPKIITVTTFRTISKLLKISDIMQYKNFILSMPDIDTYVTVLDDSSGKQKFKYQLQEVTDYDNVPNTITEDKDYLGDSIPSKEAKSSDGNGTNSKTTNKSINNVQDLLIDDTWKTCYGTSGVLSDMLTAFWPAIQFYIDQNPMHDHAVQWKQWIHRENLHAGTDLNHLKKTLGITTMDQIYVFLRDSPAINSVFELRWDHEICYRQRLNSNDTLHTIACDYPVTPIRNNDDSDTESDMKTPALIYWHVQDMNGEQISVENNVEFEILHKCIYDTIDTWSYADNAQSHPQWLTWKKW
jgi:hypothetical protein